MRQKLNTFSEFAGLLFPHELDYLLSIQKFNKPLNLSILNQIKENATSGKPYSAFDTSIDKRTYSYMKSWITETLLKIDVDNFFEWLISTEKKILTDIIIPSDEVIILSNLNQIISTDYNFIRFFEMIQYYRDYLLVRNRTKHIKVVVEFIDKNRNQYLKLKETNNRIDNAAEKIVKKPDLTEKERNEIEEFLSDVYYNQTLDGYTRYRAVVRLTILFYNYRLFEKQLVVYNHLDKLLETPLFYSKRILSNYYANRAMMHSKLNDPEMAEKYGYLSLQNKNSDYLFYLLNLCDVLIRQKKNAETLKLMRSAIPELKKTNNSYYKIGFASFYMRTLIANNQTTKAMQYGLQYFEAYKKEIFEHRWHLFLSSLFFVLWKATKYDKIILLSRRYNLVIKEKNRIQRPDYLPIIEIYTYSAEYMDGNISKDKLIRQIIKAVQPILINNYSFRRIIELLNELSAVMPDEIREIKKEIQKISVNA